MLLNTQIFAEHSSNPLLELSLLRVLLYRRTGFITPMNYTMNIDANPLENSNLFSAPVQWSWGSFREEPPPFIALIQNNELLVRLLPMPVGQGLPEFWHANQNNDCCKRFPLQLRFIYDKD